MFDPPVGGGGAATGVTVTAAVFATEGSACEVADTVMFVETLTFGAVNRPPLLIVPPDVVQVTAVFVLPVTVARNCCDALAATDALDGVMVIATGGGAGAGGGGGAFTVIVIPATVLLNAAVRITDVSDVTLPVVTVKLAVF